MAETITIDLVVGEKDIRIFVYETVGPEGEGDSYAEAEIVSRLVFSLVFQLLYGKRSVLHLRYANNNLRRLSDRCFASCRPRFIVRWIVASIVVSRRETRFIAKVNSISLICKCIVIAARFRLRYLIMQAFRVGMLLKRAVYHRNTGITRNFDYTMVLGVLVERVC